MSLCRRQASDLRSPGAKVSPRRQAASLEPTTSKVSEGGQVVANSNSDRSFQLETVGLQIVQAHEVTFYSAFFGVGASFEVFSLTILLTAVLLKGEVPAFILVLIALYLMTGIFFLVYASLGFRRTRRRRQAELTKLAEKYLSMSDR
jgi:hypothetical protein